MSYLWWKAWSFTMPDRSNLEMSNFDAVCWYEVIIENLSISLKMSINFVKTTNRPAFFSALTFYTTA